MVSPLDHIEAVNPMDGVPVGWREAASVAQRPHLTPADEIRLARLHIGNGAARQRMLLGPAAAWAVEAQVMQAIGRAVDAIAHAASLAPRCGAGGAEGAQIMSHASASLATAAAALLPALRAGVTIEGKAR